MTKSKEKKALKKEQKAAARSTQSAGVNLAQDVSGAIGRVAKKKGKKGGSGWWGLLAGAAKMAGELAPVLGPLLLAKHAPSAGMAQASGGIPAGSGPPIAQTASCSTCLGMYNIKQMKSQDGRVAKITVSGMDYLGQLVIGGQNAEMGDLLSEVDLNPASSDWAGTTLQAQMRLYERFKLKRVVCMVEPSCPATQAGQVLSFVDPDADDEWQHAGRTAVQIGSAYQGAEVSQVWGMNCAGYYADPNTQDYYVDADGSDARLVSPGTWRILATTEIDASTVIGSKYVVWEYELTSPQIEDNIASGRFATLNAPGTTGQSENAVFGTNPVWSDIMDSGNFTGSLSAPGSGPTYIYGLPKGDYFGVIKISGTVITDFSITPDGVNYTGTVFGSGTTGSTDSLIAFILNVDQPTKIQTQGYMAIECAATTVTDCALWISTYPAGETAKRKRRTLQSYEKQVERMALAFGGMQAQITQLVAVIAAATAVPEGFSRAPASAPSPSAQLRMLSQTLSDVQARTKGAAFPGAT